MPTEIYDNHHDNEEIQQLVERSHYRLISWEGALCSCWYCALGTRLYAAKRHYATQYLKQNGRLPVGIHLVKVTFGPGADVEREISSKGILTQVVGFGMDQLPPMPNLKLGQFIRVPRPNDPDETTSQHKASVGEDFSKAFATDSYIGGRGYLPSYGCHVVLEARLVEHGEMIAISMLSYAALAEVCDYYERDEDGDWTGEYCLPERIGESLVQGIEGEIVVGYELVPIDESEDLLITPDSDGLKQLRDWLKIAVDPSQPASFELTPDFWGRLIYLALHNQPADRLGRYLLNAASSEVHSSRQLYLTAWSDTAFRFSVVDTNLDAPTIEEVSSGARGSIASKLEALGFAESCVVDALKAKGERIAAAYVTIEQVS
jgi:hypothetical protein